MTLDELVAEALEHTQVAAEQCSPLGLARAAVEEAFADCTTEMRDTRDRRGLERVMELLGKAQDNLTWALSNLREIQARRGARP